MVAARRLILIALAATGHTAASAAPAPAPAHGAPPLDDAIARIEAEGKPLLVEVGTSWCGPCKIFERDFLPARDVAAALGDLTLVRYDAERGHGVAAAARLQISSYPTFVVLDRNGDVRQVLTGLPWRTPAAFVGFLRKLAVSELDERMIATRLTRSHRAAPAMLLAAEWYAGERRFAEADRAYARAARDDGDTGTRATEGRERLRARWARWKSWATAARAALSGPRADVALALLATTRLAPREVTAAAARVIAGVKDPARSGALALGLAAGALPKLGLEAAARAVAGGGGVDALIAHASVLHLLGRRGEARACLARARAGASFLGHRELGAMEAVVETTPRGTLPPLLAERARLEAVLDGPVDKTLLR